MRIEQLMYLTDIVKTKSINISAERLFVTQPAISEAIHKLEEELGYMLLVRSKKGVTLTVEGVIVAKWANHILYNIDAMKQELMANQDEFDDSIAGELNIGAVALSNKVFLPRILTSFYRKYPNITINAYEIRHNEIESHLKKEIATIILFNSFQQNYVELNDLERDMLFELEEITYEKLFMEPLQVIASKEFAISKEKMATISQVVEYPLVNFASYDHEEKAVYQFLSTFKEINLVVTTTNIDLLKQALLDGKGIGLFTKSIYGNLFFKEVAENDVLRVIRLKEKIYMEYYLSYMAEKELTLAERAFVNHIKQYFK